MKSAKCKEGEDYVRVRRLLQQCKKKHGGLGVIEHSIQLGDGGTHNLGIRMKCLLT